MELPLVTRYRVPYADTDQMGIVYYANYLVLFERARNEMLRGKGITYCELEEMGVVLPVVEAHLNYHAPARYDDELELCAACTEYKGPRLKISCQIRKDGRVLVEGYTVHAFVDKTMRPIRPSSAIIQALGIDATVPIQ